MRFDLTDQDNGFIKHNLNVTEKHEYELNRPFTFARDAMTTLPRYGPDKRMFLHDRRRW